MHKEQLGDALAKAGYELDRFGHYHITKPVRHSRDGHVITTNRDFRVKMCELVARVEIKSFINGHNEWVMVKSAYYKKIRQEFDGSILIDGFRVVAPDK